MYPRLIELPGGLTIYSFGFMVAMSILLASWLGGRELNRFQQEGRIGPIRVPARDKKNRKNPKSRKAMRTVPAADIMGTVTIIAAVVGIAGSKLFHILENLGQFVENPMQMIFSTGGLTFYGGLICAGLAIAWYVKQKGIPPALMADVLALGLMLGYGVGRIGCHLSGDGDWGIAADLALKPEWLPTWLWAETYPNNILGIDLLGAGVYPTPLYEFLFCTALFLVLWALRKHPFKAGWLFSLYLIFAGIERFLIEQIRVNNKFDLFGMQITQAEVVSVILIILGIIGLIRTTKRRDAVQSTKKKVPATA